jgi:hypothetical protein
MFRTLKSLGLFLVVLALLGMPAPAAHAGHGHMSPADCQDEYGHPSPEARHLEIGGDDYDHTVTFSFELTHGEKEALECLQGDDLDINILIDTNGHDVELTESSPGVEPKWVDLTSDGDDIAARHRGIEVADIRANREYSFAVSFSSDYPLDDDWLTVDVEWVPIEWSVGECGTGYIHYGEPICIVEVDHIPLTFD